jgi:hypothetical protein
MKTKMVNALVVIAVLIALGLAFLPTVKAQPAFAFLLKTNPGKPSPTQPVPGLPPIVPPIAYLLRINPGKPSPTQPVPGLPPIVPPKA